MFFWSTGIALFLYLIVACIGYNQTQQRCVASDKRIARNCTVFLCAGSLFLASMMIGGAIATVMGA
jgi:hypothetical protein